VADTTRAALRTPIPTDADIQTDTPVQTQTEQEANHG
jgi:hypothetical protein